MVGEPDVGGQPDFCLTGSVVHVHMRTCKK